MLGQVKHLLHNEGYTPSSLEAQSASGASEVFSLTAERVSSKVISKISNHEQLNTSLYVKDRFCVSIEEFSMV